MVSGFIDIHVTQVSSSRYEKQGGERDRTTAA
jgi:hypothetical protein